MEDHIERDQDVDWAVVVLGEVACGPVADGDAVAVVVADESGHQGCT